MRKAELLGSKTQSNVQTNYTPKGKKLKRTEPHTISRYFQTCYLVWSSQHPINKVTDITSMLCMRDQRLIEEGKRGLFRVLISGFMVHYFTPVMGYGPFSGLPRSLYET